MNESESKTSLKTRRTWILGSPVPAVEVLIAVIVLMFCANLWLEFKTQKIENALKYTVIDTVDFADTPLHEAVKEINAILYDAHPELGKDLVQILVDRSPATKTAVDPFGLNGPSQAGSFWDPSEIEITMKIHQSPVAETLRFSCSLTSTRYHIRPNKVYITLIHEAPGHHRIQVPFKWLSYHYHLMKYRYEDWKIIRAIKSGSGTPVDPFAP